MFELAGIENKINTIENEIPEHYLFLYKNRNKEKEENGGKLLQQLERIREIAIGRGDLKVALETTKFWAKVLGLEDGSSIEVESHRVEIFKLPDNERVYHDQHPPNNHAPGG